MKRTIQRLGWGSLLLTLLLLLPSLALHCVARSLLVGGFSLLDGGVFGLALALVTRTKRTLVIYFALGLALFSLWPLFASWPVADSAGVHLWPGAPDIFSNYFEMLRPSLFLLGVVWPFARYGQHASDFLPPGSFS